MRIIKFGALALLFLTISAFAQESNLRVGSIPRMTSTTGGFFDFSDPNAVNMKISVWGYARYPGRYLIPVNSTILEALSYAGGPTDDALLEDVRVVRTKPDSTQEIIKFDYNQLLHEPSITKNIKTIQLQPGDILLLPGEPRFYFKDYFSITLSIVSTLISMTILIVSLVKK
jgi:polysaccharide export outer membrane protein